MFLQDPKFITAVAAILLLTALSVPSGIEQDALRGLVFRPIPRPRIALLVVGDSLSISLGEQLEKHFLRYAECVHFQRLGRVSSGLARPDFFNWEENLTELVAPLAPDIVVIMIGANDNKPLIRDQKSIAFGSELWRREYKVRLQRLHDICRRGNRMVRVIWMGVPIMRDPLLTREVRFINETIESWCRNVPACTYVSTWATLADEDGKFTDYLLDSQTGLPATIRTKDGVHLTSHGSLLLAEVAIEVIQEFYSFDGNLHCP